MKRVVNIPTFSKMDYTVFKRMVKDVYYRIPNSQK